MMLCYTRDLTLSTHYTMIIIYVINTILTQTIQYCTIFHSILSGIQAGLSYRFYAR